MGIRDDEFAVLAVGRLVPIKNKRLAVEAMKLLSEDVRKRLRMYIIGDGEEEAFLRALAVSEGVADVVRLMGHRDDAIDLLYGGDAFYMPSHIEGMPLAMLEAMAVGLPVISAPWPGVSDVLRNGEFGIILSDWSPQTSATAFEYAMRSTQVLADMATNAQHFVRAHHSIERVAQLHQALYLDLAVRKGVFSEPYRETAAAH